MAKDKETYKGNIHIIEFSSYVRPEIVEHIGRNWVLNGKYNSFFHYIIDRYNGSPTNESIINVYCELIYGKGIAINGQDEIYEDLAEIFPKREQRKCIKDFKLFGQYDMQILKAKGGGIAKILHLPTNMLGMDKIDEDGNIKGVWFSSDWTDTIKFPPKFYPAFTGELTEDIMVKSVRPYQPSRIYFSDPDYLAGLQYAELEEEISNFSINHIKNGLSFGYIINFNNGAALGEEKRNEIERKVKKKLTGSGNAGGVIISFNDGKDSETTIESVVVNSAHKQWEFLSGESMKKILTAHGVTSPLLFGLASAGGFGSNAQELDTASKLLQDYQINPKQDVFIDELASLLELAGLETDLVFIPLRETYKSQETVETTNPIDNTVDEEESENVELSEHFNYNDLIELGEDINYEEWDLIEDERCEDLSLSESQLNTIFQFAQVPVTTKKKSSQDTSLFKIRYRYAGNSTGEREFCKKVLLANKVYRAEDLNANFVYNEDFAPKGSTSYNIFLYKGGVNCKHWWQRIILLKKGNKVISVNQARKLILELKPSERKDAKWEQNDPKVAVIASPSNNHWKLN